jgi:phenylacetate-coenzyme A ligase PaaK-like adenylate-forming protein
MNTNYQLIVKHKHAKDEVEVKVEVDADLYEQLSPGSIPRSESGKLNRIVDLRKK